MNSKENIINGIDIANQLLEELKPVIGLIPGSFKPPHKGHFKIVENASKMCDEVYVIISNNDRDGYTPELSEKIWKKYKKLLPNNVNIVISKAKTPITEVYNIVKDKSNNYIVVYGKDEEDRYSSINENREKYSNVKVIDGGNIDNISATELRKAISERNLSKIEPLIPDGIKVYDFFTICQLNEIQINKPNESYGITQDGKRIVFAVDKDGLIDASDLNLVKLVIKDKNIKSLYCYDNQLTSLNLQGLTNLEYLYCANNQLTSLNLEGTNLGYIYCDNNKLTSLNLQGLTNLEYLYCYNNQLTSLNLEGLTKLKKLYHDKNIKLIGKLNEIQINKPGLVFPNEFQPYKDKIDHYIKYDDRNNIEERIVRVINYMLSQLIEGYWKTKTYTSPESLTPEFIKRLFSKMTSYIKNNHLDEIKIYAPGNPYISKIRKIIKDPFWDVFNNEGHMSSSEIIWDALTQNDRNLENINEKEWDVINNIIKKEIDDFKKSQLDEITIIPPSISLEKWMEIMKLKPQNKIIDLLTHKYNINIGDSLPQMYNKLSPIDRKKSYNDAFILKEINILPPKLIFPKDKKWVYILKDVKDYNNITRILTNQGFERNNEHLKIEGGFESISDKEVLLLVYFNIVDNNKYILGITKSSNFVGFQIMSNDLLKEGKNIGDLYHFTDISSLGNILSSNQLNTTKTSTQDHQRDFQYLSKEKRQRHKEKGDTTIKYISFSRDKLFYLKRTKIGRLPITRIKLNGNKLSNKYKFIPFNYYSGESETEYNRYNDNEGEERIPTDKPITNLNNYIEGIYILLDKIEDNETYLKQAEELMSKYPNIVALYKEKPITLERYKKEVLSTLDPYRNEEYLEEINDIIGKTLGEIKIISPGESYGINSKGERITFTIDDSIKIDANDRDLVKLMIKDKTVEVLECYGNNLTSLDVSNLPNLRILNCNNNQLTSLDISNSPNLRILVYDKETTKLIGKLKEIKVLKPGLQFPIHLTNQEEAIRIGKILYDKDYRWINAKINYTISPFKTNQFESFEIYTVGDPKNKLIDFIYLRNLDESIQTDSKKYIKLLNTLVEECCAELNIPKPNIKIINNDKYTLANKSYAGYFPSTNEIKLVIYGRTLADSCRSLSHELYHSKQNQEGRLTPDAGKDGDEFENEANSYSGKTMREFGRKYPEIYFLRYKEGLNEIKVRKPIRKLKGKIELTPDHRQLVFVDGIGTIGTIVEDKVFFWFESNIDDFKQFLISKNIPFEDDGDEEGGVEFSIEIKYINFEN